MSDVTQDIEEGGSRPAGDVLPRASARDPERFENPGLPHHRLRMADVDVTAARRAERQVAVLFVISVLGTIGIVVAYLALRYDGSLARVGLSTRALGLGMFLSLFGIGAGAIHWAKTLMPDHEMIEARHRQRGTEQERAAAVKLITGGAAEAGLGRRPLLRTTLIGALALFPLPAVFFFRDTGPLPGNAMSTTLWKAGTRLTKDPEGGLIKISDVTLGSVFHVMPEGIGEVEDVLEEKAKAAVLLMRLDPKDLHPGAGRESWGVDGIVAYSKICTHMGCPVGLYEQQTHHLLCPCHQSTFDLTQNCKVIFGPAKRPLPQLPIEVDPEGYLVASSGFHEAVGPSFWERG